MSINASKLAAEALRILPRKRLSRALGYLSALEGPKPLVDAAVSAFVSAYGVNLDEAEIPSGGFDSFDAFFTRRLRRDARPIDPDPTALVSPADGRIEDLGRLTARAELLVKNTRYTVAALLGDDTDARNYEDGHYFVVYLSPKDYHRVHAPTCGGVQYARYIPGTLFPVNRIGTQYIPQLFARNERVAIVQDSEVHGRVTTVMVGAIGVGRIGLSFDDLRTNSGHTPGERSYAPSPIPRDRGEELGVFHLGSTAIVLVPAACRLEPAVGRGSLTKMGERLALGSVDER